MNALDIIIALLTVSMAVRGAGNGFLRSAGSLIGFVTGIIVGATLAPIIVAKFLPTGTHGLLVLVLFFAITLLIGGLGENIGHTLSGLAKRFHLSRLDSLAGASFSAIVTLVSIWLLASTFAPAAGPFVSTQIQGSLILRHLDSALPPAPDVLAKLERAVGAGKIPRVFAGLEPTPAAPVTGPNADAINAAAAAGRAATVEIEGEGCGGVVEGSGFVAGTGLVATNAHVVAGINRPVVIDGNGRHAATVVVFNPDVDFAVLRTTNLGAAPLSLATSVQPRGTVGAALGYPGGGPFTISPAAVLGDQEALGRNIYDSGLVRRDIYSLQAQVRPGNSGGPLIAPDGTVFGVIFAMSTANDQVGYALTSTEVAPYVKAAASAGPVSSGSCINE